MIRTYAPFCLMVLLVAGDFIGKELPSQSRWDPSMLSQELPREIRQDVYIQEFMKIIHQWNTKATEFPAYKEMHAEFKANLEQAVQQRWQAYATTEWAEAKLKQFDQLAEKRSRPQLQLDRQAALTLSLAFAINLPSVRARYKAESLGKEMMIPTFIVFTASQELALKARHSFITSEDVSRTIFAWWTTVWPFCAPSERRM